MTTKIKASNPLALAIIDPLLLAGLSESANYFRIVETLMAEGLVVGFGTAKTG
jgi:hypothetical protein